MKNLTSKYRRLINVREQFRCKFCNGDGTYYRSVRNSIMSCYFCKENGISISYNNEDDSADIISSSTPDKFLETLMKEYER